MQCSETKWILQWCTWSCGSEVRRILLDAKDFKTIFVADGNPVCLRRGPVNLVNFRTCIIGKNGILYGTRQSLKVPDQCLVVIGWKINTELVKSHYRKECSNITACANVTLRVRCPGDAVDAGLMVLQLSAWSARHSNVENDDLIGIICKGSQVVWILLAPGKSQ